MADPKVKMIIEAIDKASPVLKNIGANLSDIGGKMSAAITLPIVGMGIALNQFGAESSKAVKDAAGDLSKLSPEVLRAAAAYDKMQEALVPVNTAFNDAKATMLEALVPVMIQLTPIVVGLAKGIADMARTFAEMPTWAQNSIIALVGFAAISGPTISAISQIASTIGTLGELMIAMPGLANTAAIAIKGLGTAFGAASLPLIGLTAGVLALKWLFDNGWVERAITAFKQLGFVIAYAWTQLGFGSTDSLVQNAQAMGLTGKRAKGGGVSAFGSYLVGERGPEILNMGASGGSITPNYAMGGAGGGVTIVYSPTISTASTDEIERMGKLIEQAQRRRP